MTDSAQKNPLSVLEDILNDAKKSQAKTDQPPVNNDQELLQAVAAKGEQQRQLDAAQVQEKLAQLQTVKQSAQYQAAADQKQQTESDQADEAAQFEGQDIIQLGHTKI